MVQRLILVQPRGFCAGVFRAIHTVEAALRCFGSPIYVRRSIVHNHHVISSLKSMGADFIHEVDLIPEGSTVVFSAHGAPRSVYQLAIDRGLRVIDATCPLVEKVHRRVRSAIAHGKEVLLIGHAGHDEIVATQGQAPAHVYLVERAGDVASVAVNDPAMLEYVTQTTLSPAEVEPVVTALKQRFPLLNDRPSSGICFATRNRQMAARWLAEHTDLVLVLGDPSSSNSHRLQEVAAADGCPAYLIDTISDLQESWLDGATTVGLTAGASTPEDLVQQAASYFRERGVLVEEHRRLSERRRFPLPKEVSESPLLSDETPLLLTPE